MYVKIARESKRERERVKERERVREREREGVCVVFQTHLTTITHILR